MEILKETIGGVPVGTLVVGMAIIDVAAGLILISDGVSLGDSILNEMI